MLLRLARRSRLGIQLLLSDSSFNLFRLNLFREKIAEERDD